MSLRSTTLPLYFCNLGSYSAILRWHMSISVPKWTSSKSHAGLVSSFFHSLSTAAFASGFFIACGIGINLCTKLYCVIEVNPSPAMWTSWFLDCEDSTRCLVDSWDSTTQSCVVLNSFSLPILGFAFALTMLGCLLHGIAGAIGVSNFLLVFLRISEYSLSSGSMKYIPLSRRALSSFDFSFFRSCFSRFWATFPILVHTSRHTWSGLVVVWTFVTTRQTTNIFGKIVFQYLILWILSKNLTNFCSRRRSNYRQSFFSCNTSRSVWVDLVTSMYFSRTGNVSSFGT